MSGERRRWRPTPRGPTLSLGELIDASARAPAAARPAPGGQQQKQEQQASKRRKKKKPRSRGKIRATGVADARNGEAGSAAQRLVKVLVTNMVDMEELEDADERADVEEGLRAALSRHGKLQSLVVDDASGVVTAEFADLEGARVAVAALDGSVYGSHAVSARLATSDALSVGGDPPRATTNEGKDAPVHSQTAEKDIPRKKSKRPSKLKNNVIRDRARRRQQQQQSLQDGEKPVATISLVIHNLLDPEELRDDDEYEDVCREANDDLSKHGAIEELAVVRSEADISANADVGSIVVRYKALHAATEAFEFYNGKVFGGRQVTCVWIARSVAVRVNGMIDPEELEDSDEYEDIKGEVSEYFAGYDQVTNVQIVRESGDCVVECESEAAASEFIGNVDGKKYGGRPLKAYLAQDQQDVDEEPKEPSIQTRISPAEVAAEAAATQTAPSTSSTAVTELAIALLQRLATLQERAHVQNPLQDKRSRRLVLGLHEVRRGVVQQKIKLLIIGTDVEDAKSLGDAVHELVATAQQQEIPVIYPMNRRKLGRVLKKSVRVSCVGVYSVDGANDIFKQLLSSS